MAAQELKSRKEFCLGARNILCAYIQIPFCRSICLFCCWSRKYDVRQVVSLPLYRERYLDALQREIRARSQVQGERDWVDLKVIHFGGGTPSLLRPGELGQVLDVLLESYDCRREDLITIGIEVRPEDLTPDWLRGVKAEGFNRISMGVQSFDPDTLRLVQRRTPVEQVLRAYEWIRAEDFHEVNLDLLYGLPRQFVESTQRDVETVARLAPEHIDAHPWKPFDGCSLDSTGTDYQEEKGKKVAAARWMCDYLEAHGYENYNHRCFCTPGHENLMHLIEATYSLPFLGFGAGCEQFRGPKTTVDIQEYIQADYAPNRFTPIQMPLQEFDLLYVIDGAMRELQLPEGIDLPRFNERYRCDLREDLLEGKMQIGTASALDAHRAARLQLLRKMRHLYQQGIIMSEHDSLKLADGYRISGETWAFYMQAC